MDKPPTTPVPYDGAGRNDPPWWPSRYGPGDELGAANELTPERVLEALRIPRQGRVIQLAQVLGESSPGYRQRFWKQVLLTHETALPLGPEGSRLTSIEEVVTQTYQIGTHLDTLGHGGVDGRFYNGARFSDFFTPTGLTRFGPSTLPAWVSRGVCLDIAGLLGVAMVEGGFEITPGHLEAACARQQVDVRAGDAVLVHTGWGAQWDTDVDGYLASEPGCGWEAAHWLTDRRVSLVGADNWAFEVHPPSLDGHDFRCHQHLLAETGTYIVENLRTLELAAQGVSEFLWVMSPIRTTGSTGSQISPVAVV